MSKSMRFEWRNKVVDDGLLSLAQVRVLLALESYADPDGSNAHPGIDRLVDRLGINERTVRRALKYAEGAGYVVKTEHGRRGRERNLADVYALKLPGELPDIQMSTSGDTTTGHSDVHQSADDNRPDCPDSVPPDSPTTGHSGPDYRTFADDWWTPRDPPTSSSTPVPLSPDSLSRSTQASTAHPTSGPRSLPENWKPNYQHYFKGSELDFTNDEVNELATDFRRCMVGEKRTDWDKAFGNYLTEAYNGTTDTTYPTAYEDEEPST